MCYPVTDESRKRFIDKHCTESLAEEMEEELYHWGGGVLIGEPTETADSSLQELMEAGPTVREPALDPPKSSAYV